MCTFSVQFSSVAQSWHLARSAHLMLQYATSFQGQAKEKVTNPSL